MAHKDKQQKSRSPIVISLQTRERLNKILAERTGQPIEVIEKDTDRDNYMTAEQAKAYGFGSDEAMENSAHLS